jgi:CubicO group peptidase (beta-lactamase class C family)
MHDVMAGYVERGQVPCIVTLVSRHGEVHVDALGTKTVGGTDPVTPDTLFRIASVTKPVTAAATMILVEEGQLRLDDPIDHFVPELADRKVLKRLDGPLDDTVPANRPISVRDLLTFRMGFGLVMTSPDRCPILKAAMEKQVAVAMPAPGTMVNPDEWIRRLGTLPLMHQPGEKWMYNTGSDVLSVLIARAAGQPFDTFLRERLFEPLGMKDTGFSVPAAKLDRLATSYWTNFQTGKVEIYDPAVGGQWSRPPAFPSGASGLVSTAHDCLAFNQMLLNRGKHGDVRLLSPASVDAMTTDQLTPGQKAASDELFPGFFETRGWGFGLAVITKRGHPWEPAGQFGWDGGLGTSARSDPHEQMTGILLTQTAWTSPSPPDVCRDFWTLAYQAIND